jgi:hypothetical protein
MKALAKWHNNTVFNLVKQTFTSKKTLVQKPFTYQTAVLNDLEIIHTKS